MATQSGKQKLTRGEKWLLVAPFFVLLALGVTWLRNATKPVKPYLTIVAPPKTSFYASILSPDGKYIVASNETTMSFYDARSGAVISTIPIGTGYGGTALAISPDSKKVVSGWDFATYHRLPDGAVLGELETGAGSFNFSADGQTLAMGAGGQAIARKASLWNARSGKFLGYVDKAKDGLKSNSENFSHRQPHFSPDGKLLACIASSGVDLKQTRRTNNRVQIWDIASGKLQRVLSLRNIVALTFSPDGKKIAISAYRIMKERPQVQLYNVASGALIWAAENRFQHNGITSLLSADGVAFSPNGKTLACQDELGRVLIYNAQNGRLLHTFTPPSTVFFAVSWSSQATPDITFSHDGKTLLSRCQNSIYLWNTEDWKTP